MSTKSFKTLAEETRETKKEIANLKEKWKGLKDKVRGLPYGEFLKPENRAIDNEMLRIQEREIELERKLAILAHNTVVMLYRENIPTILETLKKYANKPYGPKTKEKIAKEISGKTGCVFWISDRWGTHYEYGFRHSEYPEFEVSCGTAYKNGECLPLLVDNRIQAVGPREISLFGRKDEYVDDIPAKIQGLQKAREAAINAQKELENACSAFNSLAYALNIKPIYAKDHIYSEW